MKRLSLFLTPRLPDTLAGAVSSALTLNFKDPQVERAYRKDLFRKSLGQIRLALILGILLYGVFGALDAYLIPDAAQLAWAIRYLMILPFATGVLLLSYTRFFEPLAETAVALISLIDGLGIVAMVAAASPPGNYLYYAGLLLVVTFNLTFLRPRFPVATASAWIHFGLYEVTALWISQTPTAILVNNTFFFVAFNVIAMMANYSLESYMRSDFLQRQIIREQTERLEENLSEVERRRREAEAHAQIDSLTGLYNRRYFFAMLDFVCNRDRRSPGNTSVLLMDLDHFKTINDTYGHLVGDQVLQGVSQTMRFGIRQGDIPCRYGGEEFAILLPQADLGVATAVGERLREILARTLIPTDKGQIGVTTSVGVACLDEHDEGYEVLLERADKALYTAKRAGRNRVCAAGEADEARQPLPNS